MDDLRDNVAAFGADPKSLHLFDNDSPDLLPYATLLTARRADGGDLSIVRAVYEWQGAPLMFLAEADCVVDEGQLHRIRRLLSMRGDAPYLALVAPGQLQVYRLALDGKSPAEARVDWGDDDAKDMTAFARLANIRPQAAISKRTWISNVVLNLLTGSIDRLIEIGEVSDEDAISLVGRGLFTRFLADRHLLPASMVGEASASDLFDNPHSAHQTSIWLDETFNGDLLPLSDGIFSRLSGEACQILGDVLRRAPDSQLFLGWEEKWDNLDFSHIPVGVLSQAYELYLRNHAPARQRREGGYYTPRSIADLLVRASFRSLERQEISHEARVLDPAAGAGVFLLTAFRELVGERWRIEGRRPDTGALRSILDDQIVGFDINEAALRFAALGLYLMSIELDPNPRPVDKLGFNNLRGKVLHLVSAESGEKGSQLGSLGPAVGDDHIGRYDLVVGNPPWASGTRLPDWNLIRSTVSRISVERGIASAPPLPNEVLDIPFVWRAMEWAKPGGQIAFALHARLLFQQGDGMAEARQAVFDALDVTSIINGAELRQTKVWPEISAPFCLLFAKNRPPMNSAGFRFISPRIETSLNEASVMRVDATSAEVVPAHQLRETPEILKILFRGTKADLGIVERMRLQAHPTLKQFWLDAIGEAPGGHPKGSGNGYQRIRPSSPVRAQGDGLPGYDARSLHDLPEITADTFSEIEIDHSRLELFKQERVHRIRSRELFAAPFVLVHKSPPAFTGRISVSVSEKDAVFNETFYGYSPVEFSNARGLTRYMALVLGSRLAVWFALMTSGEFGFEREVVEKATLDRMPIPDFRRFACEKITEIEALYEDLVAERITWEDVDEWVSDLYGLGPRDLQVISDTLHFNLPFARNKRDAQAAPTVKEQTRFCKVLSEELGPWFKRLGTEISIRSLDHSSASPWYGLELRKTGSDAHVTTPSDWESLLSAADEAAATEIMLFDEAESVLIGRLSQRRYWSETQARLLAQRIVWSYPDFMRGVARA